MVLDEKVEVTLPNRLNRDNIVFLIEKMFNRKYWQEEEALAVREWAIAEMANRDGLLAFFGTEVSQVQADRLVLLFSLNKKGRRMSARDVARHCGVQTSWITLQRDKALRSMRLNATELYRKRNY